MALILGWAFAGVSALAGVLTLYYLERAHQIEIEQINTDILLKTMWHERVWDPDNEH